MLICNGKQGILLKRAFQMMICVCIIFTYKSISKLPIYCNSII